MNTIHQNSKRFSRPTRATRAEAAAWLARLQAAGPDSTVEGFQQWLNASPENAAAFERATDTWEDLGGLPKVAMLSKTRSQRPREFTSQRRLWVSGAIAAAVLVATFGILSVLTSGSDLSTGIGEQRTVTLQDGSRLTLNTNTHVVVEPWSETREVRLKRGEAYFEVAKNPLKPFVVIAGSKRVVAVGTSFVVRKDGEDKIQVITVEGRVAVTDWNVLLKTAMERGSSVPMVVAGQRMVVASSASAPKLDQPRIEAATAWRRGEVVLDRTVLKEAIAEMNRYSPTVLVVENETTANIPVSGIFRTGDSESFAIAVASLYGLRVAKDSAKITLVGTPSK